MAEDGAVGWDVGGAHLKVARVAADGTVDAVVQLPCPLWQGMDQLDAAFEAARDRFGSWRARRHAVTMTGELADLFDSRAEGVARLVEAVRRALPGESLAIYAGRAGQLAPDDAVGRPLEVASANWLASAAFAALRQPEGVLLDVGSTTTDVVPFADGAVLAAGGTDEERLASDELVYTGVTRTPVMAVAGSVPFAGQRQRVMAELFATMADVHRLTGELPEDADQLPSADGRDKGVEASMRRLARMLGRDAEPGALPDWRRLARHLAACQRRQIEDALDRVLSHGRLTEAAPLVGAGVGRFLVRALARSTGRPYADFADLLSGAPEAREAAACCAPATALALLALDQG